METGWARFSPRRVGPRISACSCYDGSYELAVALRYSAEDVLSQKVSVVRYSRVLQCCRQVEELRVPGGHEIKNIRIGYVAGTN